MPIQIDSILAEVTKNKAAWVPKASWVTILPDPQRLALLGLQPNFLEMKNLRAAAATKGLHLDTTPLPQRVDWRSRNGRNYVSPVKNQGGCGSCVSFATAATIESMAASEANINFIDLSEADLHFCSNHGANCGGWWPTQALDEVKRRGVVDEASFPYSSAFNASGGATCTLVPNREARITKVNSYTLLSTMAERKRWLADRGPVIAGFKVYDDFFAYRSGVYTHVNGGVAGYHAVEVVGYDDVNGCWICKNSWGPEWGDQGYFKIAYGQGGIDETSTDVDDASGQQLDFPFWGVQGVVLPAPPPPPIKALHADRNADGRLEVFAIAKADSAALNIWQTRPSAGPWSRFGGLGGQVKQIAAGLNADGRLELFAIGMDDALWNNWQTRPSAGPWSGWNRLGGVVKKIAVARNSDGRLEVFGVGSDDGLYNIWQTRPSAGPWSSWGSLGGKIKDLSAALNSDGRLEVFGIGMDDALWNIWQTRPHAGPWSGWNSLGGVVKQIVAAQNSDGRLEVFAIGSDDGLYNIWQTAPSSGPWSAWGGLGGKVKQIDAELNSDGRLEVFGIGTDNALWNIWQTRPHAGPWSGWNSLGGKVKQISSARNGDGRLEVFGIGMDDGLWNTWQTRPSAGPWGGWNKLG